MTKNGNKCMLILWCILVCVSIGIGLVFDISGIASAENCETNLNGLCRTYTESSNPNGVGLYEYLQDYRRLTQDHMYTFANTTLPNTKHYLGELFDNNAQYSSSFTSVSVDVFGDDNIVKLIPRELFTYENRTLYIGKKYGFLIVTEPYGSVLQSNVIFIEVVGNVNDYLADIKLCVRESLTFVYIAQNQSMILPSVPTMDNSGILSNYVLQNGISSAVVPLAGIQVVTNPEKETRLRFFQFEKYVLGNVSFAAQIRNQNTYNIEDEEYDVNNDCGHFFTGNNYYYSATRRQNKTFKDVVNSFAGWTFDSGIDFVKDKTEWVFEDGDDAFNISRIPTAAKMLRIAGVGLDVCERMSKATAPVIYNDSNVSYNIEAQYLPNTKQSQINKYGKLIKASHAILNSVEDNAAYFRKDNYARAQFSYSHTDGENIYSQFEFAVGASLFRKSNWKNIGVVVSESSFYDINEPQEKVVSDFENANYYMLPFGEQKIAYTPKYSMAYTINAISDVVDVYLDGNKLDKQNGKYILNLTSNNKHVITFKNTNYGSGSDAFLIDAVEMENNSTTYTVAGNGNYLCKFVPNKKGVYTFFASNSFVTDILTREYGDIESNRTLSPVKTPSTTLSAYCKEGESYYVVVYNGSNSTATGVVSATELSETWGTGTNQAIQVDKNIVYNKFVVPSSTNTSEDYVVTFANAGSLQFVVRDENGNTCNIIGNSNGYLDIKEMIPGRTYYIGVWSEQNQTLVPQVSKFAGDLYRWKIYDSDGVEYTAGAGGVFALPRGKVYDIQLFVNGSVRYYNIRKTTDTLAGYTESSAVYDTTTAKLTLSDDRDMFTTIALTAQNVNGIVLNINTVFNPSEIIISKVDLENKISVEIAKSSLVKTVNYKVNGKNSIGNNFSYTGTFSGNAYTNGLKDLYNRKAVGNVNFSITTVVFTQKYSKQTYTISPADRTATINCSDTDIYNALQLYNIRYHSNDACRVEADIDVSTLGENWTPIPELNASLTGGLHKISGVNIYIPENITGSRCFGLIGVIKQDVSVGFLGVDVNITCASKHYEDYVYVGALAGQNYGGIITAACTGYLECHRNRSNLGGIVGANFGNIHISGFNGTLFGNGEMGGIAGYNSGLISGGTVNNSTIRHSVAEEAHSIGGIVGHCNGGEVKASKISNSNITIWNTAIIRKIQTRMGTIIGHLQNGTMSSDCTVENCTWDSGKIKDNRYCYANWDGRVGKIN